MNKTFDTKVSGIPCICKVTYYSRGKPAQTYGPADNCYPAEDSEFEFEILTRKGTPAAWLERKLTDADRLRLEEEWEATISEHNNYLNESDD